MTIAELAARGIHTITRPDIRGRFYVDIDINADGSYRHIVDIYRVGEKLPQVRLAIRPDTRTDWEEYIVHGQES